MAQISVDGTGAGSVDTGRMITYLGGIVSLALIAGGCVWGAKLVMRDVSGIPLVQAIKGPMRVAPDNPGGSVAYHAGLSVNEVAGTGVAAPNVDRLTLAPADAQITAEDMRPATPDIDAPAPAQAPVVDMSGTGAPAIVDASLPMTTLPASEVQSLVDQILAGADEPPLAQALAAEQPADPETPPAASDPNMVTVMVNGSPVLTHKSVSPLAVATSLRPVARKATAKPKPQATRSASNPATDPITAPIAPGTPLAQLGAYDSAAVASTEWARFTDLLGPLMADKTPVIQEAQSGGKTFFRLRAQGFADISAARRFCTALGARKTDCIPVVTR